MPDQQKTTTQTVVLLYGGKGGAWYFARDPSDGLGYHRRNGKLFQPVIWYTRANVRSGSKATVWRYPHHFRFSPESRHTPRGV